jgi:hypothetical protein
VKLRRHNSSFFIHIVTVASSIRGLRAWASARAQELECCFNICTGTCMWFLNHPCDADPPVLRELLLLCLPFTHTGRVTEPLWRITRRNKALLAEADEVCSDHLIKDALTTVVTAEVSRIYMGSSCVFTLIPSVSMLVSFHISLDMYAQMLHRTWYHCCSRRYEARRRAMRAAFSSTLALCTQS